MALWYRGSECDANNRNQYHIQCWKKGWKQYYVVRQTCRFLNLGHCVWKKLGCYNTCTTESKELESIFTGVLIQRKQMLSRDAFIIFIWTLMNLVTIINNLLDKLSKEDKTVFLFGNFNINLIKYNQHPSIN